MMAKNKGLLIFAIIAFLGPNMLYLYAAFTMPEMNGLAMQNPVALAFMIEAMMLLGLFLTYVYQTKKSWKHVLIYLVLSFAGSLAFSFPLFLYLEKKSIDQWR